MKLILGFCLSLLVLGLSTGLPVVEEDEDDKRIRGGQVSKNRADFPFAVSLIGKMKKGTIFNFCAGAIIDPEWILTAAHCFNEMEKDYEFAIVAGVVDIKDFKGPNSQMIFRDKYFVHPKYDPDEDHYDIALVKLKSKLTLNQNVQTVPICTKDQPIASEYLVYGWGATTAMQEDDSDQMKFTKLNKIDDSNCKKVYESYGFHQLCIMGDFPNAACQGDSGGSLIQKTNGVTCTRGVLSFGSDKCGTGPTVFTDVPHFQSYVDCVMKGDKDPSKCS